MKHIAIAISLLLWGCSASGTQTLSEQGRELRAELSGLSLEDGVDEREATVIAENYFRRHADTSCGSLGAVGTAGSAWVVPVFLGIAAVRADDIRIDKRTGRVSWARGPDIDDPKSMWTRADDDSR